MAIGNRERAAIAKSIADLLEGAADADQDINGLAIDSISVDDNKLDIFLEDGTEFALIIEGI